MLWPGRTWAKGLQGMSMKHVTAPAAAGTIVPSKGSGQPTATGETGTEKPTRQERRAQALHKYKQKRKVGVLWYIIKNAARRIGYFCFV